MDEGDDMNAQVSSGDLGPEYRDDLTSPTKSYITISQVGRDRRDLSIPLSDDIRVIGCERETCRSVTAVSTSIAATLKAVSVV